MFLAEAIGFGIKHVVERLLHGTGDNLAEVVTHCGLIQLDDLVPVWCRIVVHGSVLLRG